MQALKHWSLLFLLNLNKLCVFNRDEVFAGHHSPFRFDSQTQSLWQESKSNVSLSFSTGFIPIFLISK